MLQTRHIDIKTKILLVLFAVIVPTYVIVTVVQNKLTGPLLEQELRQLGLTTAEALATEIVSNKLFQGKAPSIEIERELLQRLYYQPSIIRMDVYARDGSGPELRLVTSSVDEDPLHASPQVALSDKPISELVPGEDDSSHWRIIYPIRIGTAGKKTAVKTIGMIHLLVSTRSVERILSTLWRVTAAGGVVSMVILIVALTHFLRRTVENERLLRKAEDQNVQLTEQLHEAQRTMMNNEKLAVMGQLTANFAHEIGTPLNAIGGHLQLLAQEISEPRSLERMEIINGEVGRIENIVKGFLQTTSKPDSQRQLVDLNAIIDKVIHLVRPRLDRIGLDFGYHLDRRIGPVRVVPTDIEQILLNLANNSLDSLRAKRAIQATKRLKFRITTQTTRHQGEEWAEISIYDTGVGIPKADLKNVLKPFFTTKQPGHGTGLGLTICRELASKYGGVLEITSKEGQWAQVKLRIPYRANV